MKHNISILSTAEIDIRNESESIPVGVSLTILPFVQIVYSSEVELRNKVNEIANSKATIVFTSKHAVRAVSELAETKPRDWTIFCLGKYTQIAVEKCFANSTVTMLGNTASELAALLIERKIPEVVFFCGDKRLDTLPDTLTKEGVLVNELVVYKNKETATDILHHYDGILFYSPSAVHSFFGCNAVDPTTVLFAIGDTTAASIYNYTSENVVASRVAGKVELLMKAIEYLT
jgi:uroporphyrinogen-III synthase